MKFTKNLNPERFYVENAIENRWVRLQPSIQEIKDLYNTAFLTARVPSKHIQLEITVKEANLRYERKLD